MLKPLRLALRARLGCSPLYLTWQRLRPRRRALVVTRDTDIVIEGYPRSANTFAVAAFLLAQPRPVKVAHHLHVPIQVIRAVQWGIPALVLLRKPDDAVLSWLVREPGLNVARALKDYVAFYTTLRPYRHGFVLATFEDVTRHFPQVIEWVNRRFGTHFHSLELTPENLTRIFALVEAWDKADTGRDWVTETTVARPSAARAALKAARRQELLHPRWQALREAAWATYEEARTWRGP